MYWMGMEYSGLFCCFIVHDHRMIGNGIPRISVYQFASVVPYQEYICTLVHTIAHTYTNLWLSLGVQYNILYMYMYLT